MGDFDGSAEAENIDSDHLAIGSSAEEDRPVDGSAGEEEGLLPASTWAPSAVVFKHYVDMDATHADLLKKDRGKNFPLVARLTVRIKETFKICNPSFVYLEAYNPRCQVPLTKPSLGLSNEGHDNVNSDLILYVNAVLVNHKDKRRYVVKEMLGQGTFGQVVKCWRDDTNDFVAVKVIKNQPAYYHQALVEVGIVEMLNTKFDLEDKHHIVRLQDSFVHQSHLCIVFELLTYNLFELIKENQFRGLSINLVRLFTKQLLESLIVLEDARVIHCDLKPENILLKSMEGEIKLIDFGSACLESKTVYSYIQSRFYRSPEVLLGHAYTTAIDMWSLGCVAAELFLGLPLFPGASEYDLMQRMTETLGCQPPDHILRHAKQTSRFFKRKPTSAAVQGGEGESVYTLLSASEFEEREKGKPAAGKRYFKHTGLEDIIISYSLRKGITFEEQVKEQDARRVFSHFLRGLVDFDPNRRWTPAQAAKHPFITEEPFTGHWSPPLDTSKIPLRTTVEAEYRPQQQTQTPQQQQQHPQLLQQQQFHQQQGIYSSPQFNGVAPFSPYGVSYGTSYGSYGSYGEGAGSYGSFNAENSAVYFNYATPPTGGNYSNAMAAHGPLHMVGATPPDRRRLVSMMSATPQMMNGLIPSGGGPPNHVGHAQLGMSPAANPSFRPTSLGMSPSQFTPPGPQYHHALGASPGQQNSPARYGGPTSPLRGPSGPASGNAPAALALGKAAAVGQYNRRRGRGSAVHPIGSSGGSGSLDGAAMQSWQQQQQQQQPHLGRMPAAGSTTSPGGAVPTDSATQGAPPEGGGGRMGDNHSHSIVPPVAGALQTGGGASQQVKLKNGEGGGGGGGVLGTSSQMVGGSAGGSSGVSTVQASASGASSSTGAADTLTEGVEDTPSPPDPGDWDPGYSDALLLEEGGGLMHSPAEGEATASTIDGVVRWERSGGHGGSAGSMEGPGYMLMTSAAASPGGSPNGGGWARNSAHGNSPRSYDPALGGAQSRSVSHPAGGNAPYHNASLRPPSTHNNGQPFLTPYQPQQHASLLHPSQQHILQQQQQQQQQFFLQQQAHLQQEQHRQMMLLQQQSKGQQTYYGWPWSANAGLGSLPQLASSAGRETMQMQQLPSFSSAPSSNNPHSDYPQGGASNALARSPGGSGESASVVDGAMGGQWAAAYAMSPPDQAMAMAEQPWQNAVAEGAAVGASPDRRGGHGQSGGLRRSLHGSNSLPAGRPPPAVPGRREHRRL